MDLNGSNEQKEIKTLQHYTPQLYRLIKQKKIKQAFDLYQILWMIYPNERDRLRGYQSLFWDQGLTECKIGNWNKGKKILERLRAIGVSSFELHYLLACIYKIEGNEKWVEEFERASLLEPYEPYIEIFNKIRINEMFLKKFCNEYPFRSDFIPLNKKYSGKIRNVMPEVKINKEDEKVLSVNLEPVNEIVEWKSQTNLSEMEVIQEEGSKESDEISDNYLYNESEELSGNDYFYENEENININENINEDDSWESANETDDIWEVSEDKIDEEDGIQEDIEEDEIKEDIEEESEEILQEELNDEEREVTADEEYELQKKEITAEEIELDEIEGKRLRERGAFGNSVAREIGMKPLLERMDLARTTKNIEELTALLYDRSFRVMRIVLNNPTMPDSEVINLVKTTASAERLGVIAENNKWRNKRAIKLGIVHNPRTLVRHAQVIIKYLSVKELMGVLNNRAITGEKRKLAQTQLRTMFRKATNKEKEAAILSSRGELIRELMNISSREERMLLRLVKNKSLDINIVYNLAKSSSTPPSVLGMIAGNPGWASRANIAWALIKNPKTPRDIAGKLMRTTASRLK